MHALSARKTFHYCRVDLRKKVIRDFGENADALWAQVRTGSIKLYDALVIADVLKSLRPKKILEVGAYIGFSARYILELTKSYGAEVVSIDPNTNSGLIERPYEFFKEFVQDTFPDRSRFVEAYMAREGECPSAAERIDGNFGEKFDLIFIDADHQYASVKRDFEICKSLLNPGGVILFHDVFSHLGVKRLMEEIAPISNLRRPGKALHPFLRMLKKSYDELVKFKLRESIDGPRNKSSAVNFAAKRQETFKGGLLSLPQTILYDLWYDGVGILKT